MSTPLSRFPATVLKERETLFEPTSTPSVFGTAVTPAQDNRRGKVKAGSANHVLHFVRFHSARTVCAKANERRGDNVAAAEAFHQDAVLVVAAAE
jgi:hypothetical protein